MRSKGSLSIKKPEEIGHRLRIQTIDAFCASSRARCRSSSGFGAQPASSRRRTSTTADAAHRTIAERRPPRAPAPAPRQQHGCRRELVATMLAKRDQWLRKAGSAALQKRSRARPAAERAHPRARESAASEGLARLRERCASPTNAHGACVAPGAVFQQTEPLRAALEALLRHAGRSANTDDQWKCSARILELLPPLRRT